jgi:CheY-like chemotaxis protein
MTRLADGNEHVVLVVEDEEIIRTVACEALNDAGFDVVETEHADEAVRILRKRAAEIHALFTDIQMPGSMDGLALAHLSRRSWPWIALLIASGLARPQAWELPKDSRFVIKPYRLDHIVGHLQEMLAGRLMSPDRIKDQEMSDRAEGAVADAGETVQRTLNQAGDAQDQLIRTIRDNPLSAVLIAVGIGYLLGKIT